MLFYIFQYKLIQKYNKFIKQAYYIYRSNYKNAYAQFHFEAIESALYNHRSQIFFGHTRVITSNILYSNIDIVERP